MQNMYGRRGGGCVPSMWSLVLLCELRTSFEGEIDSLTFSLSHSIFMNYVLRIVPSVGDPSKEQFVHSFHEIESDQGTHAETISSFLYST